MTTRIDFTADELIATDEVVAALRRFNDGHLFCVPDPGPDQNPIERTLIQSPGKPDGSGSNRS